MDTKKIMLIAAVIVVALCLTAFFVFLFPQSFFPAPDEVIIYSGGQSVKLKGRDAAACIRMLDKYVDKDSQTHAALFIMQENIARLEETETCIELIYYKPITLEIKAHWENVQRLFIQLSDDDGGASGLVFYAKDDVYQPGPWLAFNEAGVNALLSRIPALID